jgi:RNA polymerase sigma-70 factor (ECF subfamily)
MPDPQSPPDEALIVRIADGDRDAFAVLYRQCRPDVYRFAVNMSGSPTVAEDVVQEVFVALITDASRYRPGQSGVLPWLFGIARNHVRRFRSQRAVLPLPDETTRAGQVLAVERDPLIELTRQRHDDALRRALLALPARYREAIVLCDLHELSYDAAARAIGCAVGTIRSRLHRGRARLARSLCDVRNDLIVARDPGLSRSADLPRRAGLGSRAELESPPPLARWTGELRRGSPKPCEGGCATGTGIRPGSKL